VGSNQKAVARYAVWKSRYHEGMTVAGSIPACKERSFCIIYVHDTQLSRPPDECTRLVDSVDILE